MAWGLLVRIVSGSFRCRTVESLKRQRRGRSSCKCKFSSCVLRGVEIEKGGEGFALIPWNGYKQGGLVYAHSILVAVLNSAKEAAVFLKRLNKLSTIFAFVKRVVLFFITSPSLCRNFVEVGVLLQTLTHRIHQEPR